MHAIPYRIRRSRRARQVKISVCVAGVIVTAPMRFPVYRIAAFIEEKAQWIKKALEHIKKQRKEWQKREAVAKENYHINKSQALQFIYERINVYNGLYGFSFNRVSVKNMKSRWGSCSSKKNLNFHYRLLFLPIDVADYVVVHELCHLKEPNHSKQFWSLVGQTVPEYKHKRQSLRQFLV